MNRPLFIVSSITYAMKGRDILNKHGFKSTIKRLPKNKVLSGCGYGILVFNNPDDAEKLLLEFNIKVLDRMDLEETK